MAYYNNYLAHHGILGQKWGKKSGPPYPLDVSDHTASEKKAASAAGVKVGSDSGKGSITKVEKKTDSQKETKKVQEPLTEDQKQKLIRSGNANNVKKYSKQLTNQELREAIDRMDLNSRLDSYKVANDTFNKIDKTIKKVDRVSGWAKTGVNTWNLIAITNNALNKETKLPVFNTSALNGSNKKKNS